MRPVPVIPVALSGLWGSFFSRIDKGRAMTQPFRRGLFNRIDLRVGAPMSPAAVTPESLRTEVAGLIENDAPPPVTASAGRTGLV